MLRAAQALLLGTCAGLLAWVLAVIGGNFLAPLLFVTTDDGENIGHGRGGVAWIISYRFIAAGIGMSAALYSLQRERGHWSRFAALLVIAQGVACVSFTNFLYQDRLLSPSFQAFLDAGLIVAGLVVVTWLVRISPETGMGLALRSVAIGLYTFATVALPTLLLAGFVMTVAGLPPPAGAWNSAIAGLASASVALLSFLRQPARQLR